MRGAFVATAKFLMDDAYERIRCRMLGIPEPAPLPPLIVISYVYVAIQDFTYKHVDQDVNRGEYTFKKDDIIHLRDQPTDVYGFMYNHPYIKYIGKSFRCY